MEVTHTCAHTHDNNKSALIGLSATGLLFSAAMVGISFFIGIGLVGGNIWFIMLGVVYIIQFGGCISGIVGAASQARIALLILCIAEFTTLGGSLVFLGAMAGSQQGAAGLLSFGMMWINFNLHPFLWGAAITLGIQSYKQMLRVATNPNESNVCGHSADNNKTMVITTLSLLLIATVPLHIFYWLLTAGSSWGAAILLSGLGIFGLIAIILGLIAAAGNLSPKVRANMYLAFVIIAIIGLCVQNGMFITFFGIGIMRVDNSAILVGVLVFILLVMPVLLFLFSGAKTVMAWQARAFLVSNTGYVPLGEPGYAPQTYADSGTILPPYNNTQYGNPQHGNPQYAHTQYGNPAQYHATGHNIGTNYTNM